jgi:3-phytase
MTTLIRGLVLWSAVSLIAVDAALAQELPVVPAGQTDPVPSRGDAADDPAIFVHPTDPARSLILGTDKKAGLAVYDLSGKQLQFLRVGRVNNVDLRVGVRLGDRTLHLAAASDRDGRSIRFFEINQESLAVREITPPLSVGVAEPYGMCLWRRASDGALFAIVNDKDGRLEQWKLGAGPEGVSGELVRSMKFDSQIEGMVADDETGMLYVSEEVAGVWRLAADPSSTEPKTRIASPIATSASAAGAGSAGQFAPDAEGLAIYAGRGGLGYLILSSQGDSTFRVFERQPPNRYVGSFSIAATGAIDEVNETDGVDVTSASLGALFPMGLLVVQDGKTPGSLQNFKLVPWENVAKHFSPPLLPLR